MIESNIRGLRALRAQSSSYGGLLTPVLISKLPTELHLVIKEGEWEFEFMMDVVERWQPVSDPWVHINKQGS